MLVGVQFHSSWLILVVNVGYSSATPRDPPWYWFVINGHDCEQSKLSSSIMVIPFAAYIPHVVTIVMIIAIYVDSYCKSQ